MFVLFSKKYKNVITSVYLETIIYRKIFKSSCLKFLFSIIMVQLNLNLCCYFTLVTLLFVFRQIVYTCPMPKSVF